MVVLGLTGSIAMGKTTTAALFAKQGAAVYDADMAVHALYQAGGAAGEKLRPLFPEVVGADGSVRRDVLKVLLASDASRLSILEAEIFPLLAAQRRAFLFEAAAAGHSLAVLDIPLLYETGADRLVDAVVVVTAPPEVQKARVMGRDGSDEATFALLASRQLPDLEKRRRADFLVFSDQGLEAAGREVRQIVETVLAPGWTRARRHPQDSSNEVLNTNASNAGGRA